MKRLDLRKIDDYLRVKEMIRQDNMTLTGAQMDAVSKRKKRKARIKQERSK